MADVNITGSGSNSIANNYTVPSGQTTVSFHSADNAVRVCFSNSTTFNMAYKEIPKGGQPTTLTIASSVSTNFTTNASGADCPGANPKEGGPYTITIGGGMGGGKKSGHETYKK